MVEQNKAIGYIVGGGLRESLLARLTVTADQIQEGGFVVIESGDWQFYGLVTDLRLGASDPRFADEQSEERLPAELAHLLHGQTLFTDLEVMPALMLERGPELDSPEYARWRQQIDLGLKDEPRPLPVKTVPPHHAKVRLAGPGDIAEIFGKAEEQGNFVIGVNPRAGPPGVHQPGQVRAALLRRVRRHRHGQILPDAHRAGRPDPVQPGLRAGLRHAQ